MYQRRKIIIELLNAFDGELNRTKFFKLLFLLSQKQAIPSYNFIPYHYGCYSFLAEQDISVLKKYGYLEDSDSVKLSKIEDNNKIGSDSLNLIMEIKEGYGKMNNDEIINFVYNKYPFFALNSKIKENYISEDKVLDYCDDGKKVLFSIGYEGKDIDQYLNLLIKNNIKLLCDIRRNPVSMKFGFSKNQLKNYCEKLHIQYIHFPEFGIVSSRRKNLASSDDYFRLFHEYSRDVLPVKSQEIEKVLAAVKPYNKVAFTCFEADYNSCHRSHFLNYIFANYKIDYDLCHL